MTFQRDHLQKGFEPDECWWIANEGVVRGKEKFDFRIDPPPDLAVEVEMSRSLVKRISIYAAIGVPEIWRFDGKQLRFCILQDDATYAEIPNSLSFPSDDLLPYTSIRDGSDETTRMREYVAWLRAKIADDNRLSLRDWPKTT